MVTKEDIKNLANLVRIEIDDKELSGLVPEIDSILGYVGQIENFPVDSSSVRPIPLNVMRDDVVTTESGEYTEEILKNAPSRDDNYLKVKKIL